MSAQLALEKQQRCPASLVELRVVTVKLYEDSEPFSRAVQTFVLRDHPTSKRAYVWEKLGDGTQREPEYTIILQCAGINSPEEALRSVLKAFWKSL